MKKSLCLLIVLLLIAVIISGCSKPVKQTGTLYLKFTIPQGATEYPSLPSNDRSFDYASDDVRQRPIPAGTTTLHVAVYNKTTSWSHKVSIPVDPGQTTATTQVTGIPAGGGYTVEVIPVDTSSVAISIGRADGIVVQAGISTAASLTVEQFQAEKISCPATVQALEPMSVTLSLRSPVALNSADLNNEHALLVENVANPSAGDSFQLVAAEVIDLPDIGFIDFTFEDNVPDVEGTYYLLGAGIDYTQPVTNTAYQLFFALETPPAVEVEFDDTGAITINID